MLTELEKSELAALIVSIRERTDAEIALVVVKTSDKYLAFFTDLFFTVGLVDILLIYFGFLVTKPWLLAVPWLVFAVALLPRCRTQLIGLLPQRLRYHHPARHAVILFHQLEHSVDRELPAIMVYVSLAERYAHILHSRSLNAQIPATFWHNKIKNFTQTIIVSGLKIACIEILTSIAAQLPSKKVIGD